MSGTFKCQWVRPCDHQRGGHVCQSCVRCAASFQSGMDLSMHIYEHASEVLFPSPYMERNAFVAPSGSARPAECSSNPVRPSDDADRSSNPVRASDTNPPSNPFPAPYTLRNPPVFQADGLVGIPASNLPVLPAEYIPAVPRSGRRFLEHQRELLELRLGTRMKIRPELDSEGYRKSPLRNVLTTAPPAPDAETAGAIPDADAADDDDSNLPVLDDSTPALPRSGRRCRENRIPAVPHRQVIQPESEMRLRSGKKLRSRQSPLRNVLTKTPPAPDAETAGAISDTICMPRADADAADDGDTICMPRAMTTASAARDAREASGDDAEADADADFEEHLNEDAYYDANDTPDFDTAIAEAAQAAAGLQAESSWFY